MNSEGNAYQELIATALRAIEANGQLPQSMRELAFLSGIPEDVALRYFPTIFALRTALIDQSLVLLADAIRVGVVLVDPHDPVAQLKALGQSYFSWGVANRAMFGILASGFFNPAQAEGSKLELYRQSIRDLITKKFREAMSIGRLDPNADMDLLIANSHSITLGMSSMLMLNRRDAWYQGEIMDVETLAHAMIAQHFDLIFPSPAQEAQRGL